MKNLVYLFSIILIISCTKKPSKRTVVDQNLVSDRTMNIENRITLANNNFDNYTLVNKKTFNDTLFLRYVIEDEKKYKACEAIVSVLSSCNLNKIYSSKINHYEVHFYNKRTEEFHVLHLGSLAINSFCPKCPKTEENSLKLDKLIKLVNNIDVTEFNNLLKAIHEYRHYKGDSSNVKIADVDFNYVVLNYLHEKENNTKGYYDSLITDFELFLDTEHFKNKRLSEVLKIFK